MYDANQTVRMHIKVRGHVQGVGFRAHVEYAARQLNLAGWVRNVGYDLVEALAEGEKQKLQTLEAAVRNGPPGSRVTHAEVEWLEATGEFEGFRVRRSL